MSFVFFNIEKFLESRGIYYRTEGKNISRNWIGIDCIYCGGEGQHLGIHREHKTLSCFQCGKKTNLFSFIKDLEQCSNREVGLIIKEFSDYSQEIKIIERTYNDKVVFPSRIEWKVTGKAAEFLEKRNFDKKHIEIKYNVGMTRKLSYLVAGGQRLSFDNRLIIPMTYKNKLISYTGRDYFDKKDPKYLNPVIEAVKVPTSSVVYNTHTVKNKQCVLVEGVTDVWRMGDGCISLQGITFTEFQLWLIMKLQLKRIVILFDEGARKNARKLADRLSLFIPDVQYTALKHGDPAELEESEAKYIKYQLIKR